MDKALIGRTWGPTTYVAGAEKIREFALAIHGGVPSSIYPAAADVLPAYVGGVDGVVTAPPTFCVNFAILPFITAMFDEALAIDRLRLVHGEQDLEFLAPVHPGDVLVTTGELADTYEKAGLDFMVVTTTTTNQTGATVVRGTWTAVVRK